MIYVDERTGSVELAVTFQHHRSHPAVSIKRLPAADFCFSGNGPDGPCMIGVERKTIYGQTNAHTGSQFRDLFSSIRTGRLSGEQLPKLLDHYDFIVIIVEGIFRTDAATGIIQVWVRGKWEPALCGQSVFLASEMYRFLFTLSLQPRVVVVFLSSEKETVEYIVETLQGYFAKPWDKHHAHMGLHTPSLMATIGKASTLRRMAAALKGIGWERSAAVEAHFGTVATMVNADPKEWMKIEGVGKVLSKRVWDEMHGKGNE